MHFFFIATEKQFEQNSKDEPQDSGRYTYRLADDTFVGPAIFVDSGKAMNFLNEQPIKEDVRICRCQFNPEDLANAAASVLVGNVYRTLRVTVDEMVKVSRA